jgi:hypothetical protein
MTSLGHPDRF